jgi:hypothetical protein
MGVFQPVPRLSPGPSAAIEGAQFRAVKRNDRHMSDEDSPLPSVLAEQVGHLRAKFDPEAELAPSDLVRQVDAALLNLCEYAQADMDLLNRIMGMRAAAEALARSIEDPVNTDPVEARARVEQEFDALQVVLARSRPSPMSVAMGLGWWRQRPSGRPRPALSSVVGSWGATWGEGSGFLMCRCSSASPWASWSASRLSFAQMAALLGVAMLTSKRASGVTGAGFITLAATLAVVPDVSIAAPAD